MRTFSKISIFLLICLFILSGCRSSTMIQSTPGDAKVYINSEYKGKTPYLHSDTKIVGSSFVLKIEKDGYKPFITTITKDEEIDPGAIVGGLFFGIPFLWTMKYQDFHTYELVKIENDSTLIYDTPKNVIKKSETITSKAEKLRELKKLLDEKIITQEEFEKEKAKVLALPD